MKSPTILSHILSVILLPFNVTVIIPYFTAPAWQNFIPNSILLKLSGVIFIIFGLFLFAFTLYLFITIGRGTLAAWIPTQHLVIKGPYRYCRNPMITGVLFILAGESLLFHSGGILIWTAVFFLINNIYFIVYEEPGLLKRFGAQYEEYKNNVPRWIPRRRPYYV